MKFWFWLCILTTACNIVFAQADNGGLAEKLTVQDILVSGNTKTKTNIILREMSVQPGNVILKDSLAELLLINRQRIYNTTLFTDVIVRCDTVNNSTIILNIAVKERWYIIPEITFELADRNFNVWWTEQNADIRRSIIGVTLKHQNFRGNREQLGITAQVGYRQEFSISYIKPYIDKKQKRGIGFEAGVSENNELFYTTDSNKLKFAKTINKPIIKRSWISVLYSYRPAYATTHILRATYKHSKVDDTVITLNPYYYNYHENRLDYLELSYRIDINRVDNWSYPLVGKKFVGNLFTNIGWKGVDFFTYATVEAGVYHHLHSKWYSSFIFRGKLSMPTNQSYIWRQGLGTKYEYVRGYEYYVIDGYQYGLLRSNLKYELFNFQIKKIPFKYLPVIPLRIYPKLFADAGYVSNPTPGNSFLNNRMIYSAGVGLDIFTAYDFKVRIEYAINHLGQKGLFLHFNSE